MTITDMCLCIFINHTSNSEYYTLSLHDALPICVCGRAVERCGPAITGAVIATPEPAALGASSATTPSMVSSTGVASALSRSRRGNDACHHKPYEPSRPKEMRGILE